MMPLTLTLIWFDLRFDPPSILLSWTKLFKVGIAYPCKAVCLGLGSVEESDFSGNHIVLLDKDMGSVRRWCKSDDSMNLHILVLTGNWNFCGWISLKLPMWIRSESRSRIQCFQNCIWHLVSYNSKGFKRISQDSIIHPLSTNPISFHFILLNTILIFHSFPYYNTPVSVRK